MGKILFWIIVILAALVAARILARHSADGKRQEPAPKAPKRPATLSSESMVRCAHCGIHLPRSEAILSQGKTWCSQEHAKLGVRS